LAEFFPAAGAPTLWLADRDSGLAPYLDLAVEGNIDSGNGGTFSPQSIKSGPHIRQNR
jgi:hypothetical protein